VNYYAPTILQSAGVGTNAALLLTIAVGVHEVIGTVVGIILLGHLNRRRMGADRLRRGLRPATCCSPSCS
jgi:major inositol transporter-like SP family MFS transporter